MPATSMAATGATLDPEWSVLLAAGSVVSSEARHQRLRSLLTEAIHWDRLFTLSDRHGVTPLLHQALAGISDAVPSERLRFLEQSYQLNLRKALLLSNELIRILDQLSKLGIEAIPYKGVALAELIYGDIALRQSGDIDLLIRPQDFSRARQAVRDLGFTPSKGLLDEHQDAYLKSGNECAFDGTAGPNLLEVQWAIQPRFYAIDFDMGGLFHRAVPVTVAGYSAKTLPNEDLFLVLCAHAAKHVWQRLIWLCDLARIMALPSLDWKRIQADAQALGISRILSVSMIAAQKLLGAAIPADVLDVAFEDRVAALVEEVRRQLFSEELYNVESLSYFRLMMRLRERRSDQLRFFGRLIFTPGPGEWETVQLPRPFSPLYRLIRLSRVAARLLRA